MRKPFSMLARLADVGWRARCSESCTAGSGKGGRKRIREDNALTAYFTALVQHYAPELDKRCRSHLKACNDSWKVDETYIKILKTWMYLYRAVDSEGNTAELKASGALPEAVELRQVKYLNNLVEQDHRFIKRLVKPGMEFFSFETAGRTLQGYECMHMLRKRQMQGVAKGDSTGQVTFIAHLFGMGCLS